MSLAQLSHSPERVELGFSQGHWRVTTTSYFSQSQAVQCVNMGQSFRRSEVLKSKTLMA